MAERPIFLPTPTQDELVKEVPVKLVWHSGFAEIQKKRNIHALHEAAARLGYGPLLEVSTKSDDKVGQHLSAFHLKVHSPVGDIPLECAFQGSKVFEYGDPTPTCFRLIHALRRETRDFESRGVSLPLNLRGCGSRLSPRRFSMTGSTSAPFFPIETGYRASASSRVSPILNSTPSGRLAARSVPLHCSFP